MNQAPAPPVTTPAGDSSARVTKEPRAAAFVAPEEDKLAEELARLGAVKEEDLQAAPKPAKPLITADSPALLTGKQTPENAPPVTRKQVGMPKAKNTAKPLSLTGYVWRSDGAGWELRKLVNADGKRKQPYVAHLSKTAYQQMKREHKGQALADALAQWVREREREKGG